MTNFTIAVVIPYYNNKKNIDLIIKSLKNQSRLPDEIIVVDDASPDDISLILNKEPSIIYIRHKKNTGVANARNTGLSLSVSDITLFIDSDAIPELNLLESVHDFYQHHWEKIVGVGGRAIECHISSQYDTWRATHIAQDYGNFLKIDVPFLFGVVCSYKTGWLKEFGGFDSFYSENVGEDYDLGLRIDNNRLRIAYSPSIVVNHQHQDDLKSLLRGQYLWSYWGVIAAKRNKVSPIIPFFGHISRFVKFLLQDLLILKNPVLAKLTLKIFITKFRGVINATREA